MCRRGFDADSRTGRADVFGDPRLARDTLHRLVKIFYCDWLRSTLSRFSPAVRAVPFLSSKRRPRFVQIVGWRRSANEFKPDNPSALYERFNAAHDRIHIVA